MGVKNLSFNNGIYPGAFIGIKVFNKGLLVSSAKAFIWLFNHGQV